MTIQIQSRKEFSVKQFILFADSIVFEEYFLRYFKNKIQRNIKGGFVDAFDLCERLTSQQIFQSLKDMGQKNEIDIFCLCIFLQNQKLGRAGYLAADGSLNLFRALDSADMPQLVMTRFGGGRWTVGISRDPDAEPWPIGTRVFSCPA